MDANPYQPPQRVAPQPVAPSADDAHTLESHSCLTGEDLVQYQLYLILKSDAGKPNRNGRTTFAFLLISLGLLFSWLFNNLLPLVPLLMAAITWWVGWPRIVRASARRQIQLLLNRERNARALGDQWITLTPQHIHRRTGWFDMRVRWVAIDRVVVDRDHLFILLPLNSAFIIPLRDFRDELQRRQFTELAQHYAALANVDLQDNRPSTKST